MPLPEGAENPIRLTSSDLNSRFLALNGPENEEGCYTQLYALDLRRQKTTPINDCLLLSDQAAANPLQEFPFVAENNSSLLAALVAPEVIPDQGVSDKVLLVDGASDTITTVDLPAPGDGLSPNTLQRRNLRIPLPGAPPQAAVLNTATGEITFVDRNAPFSVDVNGLTQRVSQVVNFGDGVRAAIVGDDAENQALFVQVDNASQVTGQIEFPAGYLPMIPPRRLNNSGQPTGNAFAPALQGFEDSPLVYVLARAGDNSKHAIAIFDTSTGQSSVVDFPAGVFASACTNLVRFQPLNLTQRFALLSSAQLNDDYEAPCAANEMLVFDPSGGTFKQVAAPGPLDNNLKANVNDYVFAATANRAGEIAGSLIVFDGASDTFTEISDLGGASGFVVDLTTTIIPSLSAILTLAAAENAGDEGLIAFTLGNGQARFFPLPEGFATVVAPLNFARAGRPPYGLLMANRKLIARARRPDPAGSQFIVWDFYTAAAQAVPNPEGVAFVVAPPPAEASRLPVSSTTSSKAPIRSPRVLSTQTGSRSELW